MNNGRRRLQRIAEVENVGGNVADLFPIENKVGHTRVWRAQEGSKRHSSRRWHMSDRYERRSRIAPILLFLGIGEMAAIARGLRYPPPSRNILSASCACCEKSGKNEEKSEQSRLHKASL